MSFNEEFLPNDGFHCYMIASILFKVHETFYNGDKERRMLEVGVTEMFAK